jgi:GntR family transcriptional regulator/MocR family aminotransferase
VVAAYREDIRTGELDRHIRLVRARHRTRRDALLIALRQYLPQIHVQGVAAGLHLLITFPELDGKVDDTDLAERIRQAGVRVHPLSWHRRRGSVPGLVMGYAAHSPDRLREAALRIGRTVHAMKRR